MKFEAALCASYNNWMVDVCAGTDGTLEWVAVIDFHDPDAAAAEIARAKGLGAVGVMAPGMVDRESIVAPRFEPIWAAAEQHDLGVGDPRRVLHAARHVHVRALGADGLRAGDGLGPARPAPRPAGLVPRGELQLGAVHDRAARREGEPRAPALQARPARSTPSLDRPEQGGYLAELTPRDYIERGNIYFGFEVEDPLLPYCIEQFGEDCWVYGSDVPHGDRLAHAAKVLQARDDLSESVKRKMLGDNVERFYGFE